MALVGVGGGSIECTHLGSLISLLHVLSLALHAIYEGCGLVV